MTKPHRIDDETHEANVTYLRRMEVALPPRPVEDAAAQQAWRATVDRLAFETCEKEIAYEEAWQELLKKAARQDGKADLTGTTRRSRMGLRSPPDLS